MKRVYATTDRPEAEVLRSLLRDAGIESMVDNEGGADYALGMPTSAAPLGITVSDEDAPEAARILASHFDRNPLPSEDDPEAPPPMDATESASFEEKVRRGNRRWSRWLLMVYFLPGLIPILAYATRGEWIIVAICGTALAGMLGLVWFVNLLAGTQVKTKKPAS